MAFRRQAQDAPKQVRIGCFLPSRFQLIACKGAYGLSALSIYSGALHVARARLCTYKHNHKMLIYIYSNLCCEGNPDPLRRFRCGTLAPAGQSEGWRHISAYGHMSLCTQLHMSMQTRGVLRRVFRFSTWQGARPFRALAAGCCPTRQWLCARLLYAAGEGRRRRRG